MKSVLTYVLIFFAQSLLSVDYKIRHKTEENKDIFYEDGYILKIANILEDPEALKAQNELMLHLHKKKNLQVELKLKEHLYKKKN